MNGKTQEGGDTSLWEYIGNAFGSLGPVLQMIVLLGAAVTVIAAFMKWVRPKYRLFFSDLRAIRDTLVGRPAIVDSVTKRIVPHTALPSIGERMATQEESLRLVADAVEKLATANSRLTSLELEVGRLSTRIERVEGCLTDERLLTKVEGIQMLRTIEQVASATEPPASPDTGKPVTTPLA